jgi:hypothetical protein
MEDARGNETQEKRGHEQEEADTLVTHISPHYMGIPGTIFPLMAPSYVEEGIM